MSKLLRIGKPLAACKLCGIPAKLFGVVDFNKNCEDRRAALLEISGIAIYYHRCPSCGFIFTAAFDDFGIDQFKEWIYNDQYAMVDPEYATVRPLETLKSLNTLLPQAKSVRILDYGGGNGLLAARARLNGFTDIHSFDPYVPEFSARPDGNFDCIICVEVVEHTHEPRNIFGDMISMLRDPGVIVFSTVLQPPDIERQGVGWWYVAPRNGHISIFSRTALEGFVRSFGFEFASFNNEVHIAYRRLPAFAAQWLPWLR